MQDAPINGRIIGIRHRVKATAEGEARPTQLAILENGTIRTIDLDTEQDELDFSWGIFPDRYRQSEAGEDLSLFKRHHIKTRGQKIMVPAHYEGLQAGDTIAMILGGSGDSFALGLARRGEKIGAKVIRIPAATLKEQRGDADKDDDAQLMATLATDTFTRRLFYDFRSRDADLVLVREAVRARAEAQEQRIRCEGRIRARTVGIMHRNEGGLYPEGTIEDAYDRAKGNDELFQNLLRIEKRCTKELEDALERLDIYHVLHEVEGCGPAISGRIIATIVDIRRFPTKAKLRAFMGVHVRDGQFPRRRRGQKNNWNPDSRQAMFNLGNQFVKRKESEWGLKMRDKKVRLRIAHPEVEVDAKGKKRYTDGHIHKMAYWWAIGKFAEWVFKEWKRLEKEQATKPVEPEGDGSSDDDVTIRPITSDDDSPAAESAAA